MQTLFSFTCTVVKWKIKSINQSWLYDHQCDGLITKGTLNVRTYLHRYRTARSCSSNIMRQQFQGVLLYRKSPSSIVGQLQFSVFNNIQSTLGRYFSPLHWSGSPSWIRSHYPGLGEVDQLLSIKLWDKEQFIRSSTYSVTATAPY